MVAHALKTFLEQVMQMGRPWMSDEGIGAGTVWGEELTQALEEADFAILCLTEGNYNAPWIHYEAGFLSGTKKMPVCPYIFDFDISELKGPLAQRNARKADRAGTRHLLATINDTLSDGVPENTLTNSFEKFWPDFEAALNKIRAQRSPDKLEAEKAAGEQLRKRLEPGEELIMGMKTMHRKPSKRSAKRGVRSFTLQVLNPSSYSRKGQVVVPWELIYQSTKLPPQNLIIFDDFGNALPTQVDIDDPADPSSCTLLFTLKDMVPSRAEKKPYLVHAEIGTPEVEAGDSPRIEVETRKKEDRRVNLINNRLAVRLELFPRPWDDDKDWYAGAASSVVLDGKEILNAFEVDPFSYEKRCMQIANLWLFSPVERQIPGEQAIIRKPYQLLSQSSGPVRATIKIASTPFECGYFDPNTQKQVSLKCRLKREISLYSGASYLMEKVYVQDAQPAAKAGKASPNQLFEACYFTYANFGLHLNKHHFNPQWLVINAEGSPWPGYGFAANVPIRSFENPHPGFRRPEHQHKTFSWVLSRNKTQRCLHFFMHGNFNDLRAVVDLAWYELIKEPLLVRVIE